MRLQPPAAILGLAAAGARLRRLRLRVVYTSVLKHSEVASGCCVEKTYAESITFLDGLFGTSLLDGWTRSRSRLVEAFFSARS